MPAQFRETSRGFPEGGPEAEMSMLWVDRSVFPVLVGEGSRTTKRIAGMSVCLE